MALKKTSQQRYRDSIGYEVAAIPTGYTNDNIFYWTVGTVIYEKRITSVMRAENVGVYGDGAVMAAGTDMTSRLQAGLDHTKINIIELDVKGGGNIIINSALTIPTGKILRIIKGTKITGTGSIICNGAIEAGNYTILANTITTTTLNAVDGKIKLHWWELLNNGTGNDTTPVSKWLNAISNNSKVAWAQDVNCAINGVSVTGKNKIHIEGINATFRMISTAPSETSVIQVLNCGDVKITGLDIYGHIDTSTGEQNHAIRVQLDSGYTGDDYNYVISEINAYNLGGDAIMIYGHQDLYVPHNVLIERITWDNVHRNGVSLVHVQNAVIRLCTGKRTEIMGIVLESDVVARANSILIEANIVKNITVSNQNAPSNSIVISACTTDGTLSDSTRVHAQRANYKYGLLLADVDSATVTGCTLKNSKGVAVKQGDGDRFRHISFDDCTFKDNGTVDSGLGWISSGNSGGGIAVLGALVGGTGYTTGTYLNVPLTNVTGSGQGAKATIVVSGGAATSVTITDPGEFYSTVAAPDTNTVSAAASNIGGTGSGFTVKITGVIVTGQYSLKNCRFYLGAKSANHFAFGAGTVGIANHCRIYGGRAVQPGDIASRGFIKVHNCKTFDQDNVYYDCKGGEIFKSEIFNCTIPFNNLDGTAKVTESDFVISSGGAFAVNSVGAPKFIIDKNTVGGIATLPITNGDIETIDPRNILLVTKSTGPARILLQPALRHALNIFHVINLTPESNYLFLITEYNSATFTVNGRVGDEMSTQPSATITNDGNDWFVDLGKFRVYMAAQLANSTYATSEHTYYIKDVNKQGPFFYDSADVDTNPDNATVYTATTAGGRFKRIYNGFVLKSWYTGTNKYFDSTTDITSRILTSARKQGMLFEVLTGGVIKLYLFKNGVDDVHLVEINTDPVVDDWTNNGADIYNSNAGNVGVGATPVGAKLHLTGTLEPLLKITSGANDWYHGIGNNSQFGVGFYFLAKGVPTSTNYEFKTAGDGTLVARTGVSAPAIKSNVTGLGDANVLLWTNTGGNFNGKTVIGVDYSSGVQDVEIPLGVSTSGSVFKIRNNDGTVIFQVGTNGTTKLNIGSDVTGDIYYRNASGNITRLGIGSVGQYLRVVAGVPAWQTVNTAGWDEVSNATLITSDASAVAIKNITLPVSSYGWIKVAMTANGFTTGNTHGLWGERIYRFKKLGDGTLTITLYSDLGDIEESSVTGASWTVISQINQPVVQVTGVASVVMQWDAVVTVQINEIFA